MSVSTRKAVLLAVAFLLTAPLLFAASPSARTQTRMAFDARSGNLVLFGGLTAFDSGTKKSYDLGDTWEWNGVRWVQIFPATNPPARSIHVMVYDPVRARVLLFGGKNGKTDLNDMWAYSRGEWTAIETTNVPPPRTFGGAAYDPDRDRVVMFGGSQANAEGSATITLRDTWEFDGTQWQQVGDNGPDVIKPIVVYDEARREMLMIGEEQTGLKPHMYKFAASTGQWNEVTEVTLPTCANDAFMRYQPATQTVIFSGGICSSLESGTFEWNGSAWTKLTIENAAPFMAGSAVAYDALRGRIVMFGGTLPTGDILPSFWGLKDNKWTAITDQSTPNPRSLQVFRADPENRFIWMFGGIDEFQTLADLWKYVNGAWVRVTYDNTGDVAPTGCLSPTSAYDANRKKLVVLCANSTVHEWDGEVWKKFDSVKPAPPGRRFSSLAYDERLKKVVLFGGYDETNYLNETWLWDGATWTQVKNNRPTARSNASMWFDPILQKTVIYGGVGRITRDDRYTRYSDMWSFDGSGWTDMKITATPGERYGAQVAVDPRSRHTFLFGGLVVKTEGTVQTQEYRNDTWEWNGSSWQQLAPATSPPARENGGFEFDPSRNELVLFGGYAGFFQSDLWAFDGTNWSVRSQAPQQRRRAGR